MDEYLSQLFSKEVESANRYIHTVNSTNKTKGLLSLGIKDISVTFQFKIDSYIMNTVKNIDKYFKELHNSRRLPLLDGFAGGSYEIKLKGFSANIRNHANNLCKIKTIYVKGSNSFLSFSTYNCFTETHNYRIIDNIIVPVKFTITPMEIYGNINVKIDDVNVILTSGDYPDINSTFSTVFDLIKDYITFGDLNLLDYMRLMIHAKLDIILNNISMDLRNTNDPYCIADDGLNINIKAIHVESQNIFSNSVIQITDLSCSVKDFSKTKNSFVLCMLPLEEIKLSLLYYDDDNDNDNHSYHVFPFVYCKKDKTKPYRGINYNGTTCFKETNDVRTLLLKDFKMNKLTLKMSYHLKRLNEEPTFKFAVDKIPSLIKWADSYISYFLKYLSLSYFKSLLYNDFKSIIFDKVIIDSFKGYIYDNSNPQISLYFGLNDPLYFSSNIEKFKDFISPTDLRYTKIAELNNDYWIIYNSILIINSVDVHFTKEVTKNDYYLCSISNIELYQYDKDFNKILTKISSFTGRTFTKTIKISRRVRSSSLATFIQEDNLEEDDDDYNSNEENRVNMYNASVSITINGLKFSMKDFYLTNFLLPLVDSFITNLKSEIRLPYNTILQYFTSSPLRKYYR